MEINDSNDPRWSELALGYNRRNSDMIERFKDVKTLRIGIDKKALDEQVEEKRKLKEREKEIDEVYAKINLEQYRWEQVRRNEEAALRREKIREINEFNRTMLCNLSRDVHDLNDPQEFSKSKPMRVDDGDTRAEFMTSFLKFEGEDSGQNKRERKAQSDYLYKCLNKQIDHDRKRREQVVEADREFLEDNKHENIVIAHAMKVEKRAKQEEVRIIQNENEILALEKKLRDQEAKRRETIETFDHIAHCMTSSFFNELTIDSALKRNRIYPPSFKGNKDKELQAIRMAQRKQMEDKKKWEERERLIDEERLDVEKYNNHKYNEEKKVEDDMRKIEAMQLRHYNLLLAQDQRAKRDEMERNASFQPTQEYYDQFGRTIV